MSKIHKLLQTQRKVSFLLNSYIYLQQKIYDLGSYLLFLDKKPTCFPPLS
ncbi:hypothetical protein EPYR_03301 [Erwinia pyrifoliae DSM 12163]|nr:hypothetical protein EPYR_03301 [Erwinia pyrifoliae DSM 12163]